MCSIPWVKWCSSWGLMPWHNIWFVYFMGNQWNSSAECLCIWGIWQPHSVPQLFSFFHCAHLDTALESAPHVASEPERLLFVAPCRACWELRNYAKRLHGFSAMTKKESMSQAVHEAHEPLPSYVRSTGSWKSMGFPGRTIVSNMARWKVPRWIIPRLKPQFIPSGYD